MIDEKFSYVSCVRKCHELLSSKNPQNSSNRESKIIRRTVGIHTSMSRRGPLVAVHCDDNAGDHGTWWYHREQSEVLGSPVASMRRSSSESVLSQTSSRIRSPRIARLSVTCEKRQLAESMRLAREMRKQERHEDEMARLRANGAKIDRIMEQSVQVRINQAQKLQERVAQVSTEEGSRPSASTHDPGLRLGLRLSR